MLAIDKLTQDEEYIKMFVAVASFLLLGLVYAFNATNGDGNDIPTDILVAFASLIVGYYFGRGKHWENNHR